MLPAKFFNPSCFATDITARTGNTTAVSNIPTIAGIVLLPASAPRSGGNIRLPAPKNMENSVNPITHLFLIDKLFINHSYIPSSYFFVINSRMPRYSSNALTILYNLPVHHHRSHQNCPYTTDRQFLFPDDPCSLKA